MNKKFKVINTYSDASLTTKGTTGYGSVTAVMHINQNTIKTLTVNKLNKTIVYLEFMGILKQFEMITDYVKRYKVKNRIYIVHCDNTQALNKLNNNKLYIDLITMLANDYNSVLTVNYCDGSNSLHSLCHNLANDSRVNLIKSKPLIDNVGDIENV